MSVVINGTTDISSTGGYAGDGVSFADGTPANTLVTDTVGQVGIGVISPSAKLQVMGSGTSTSFRGNVNALITSNGSGYDSTLRLSDSVANSADISMKGGVLATSVNGVFATCIDSSGQLKTMVTGGSAVMDAYACRAWVNFNGTGTVAVRGSGNVSSITDNGVGDYTVNFTTAMPDVNYSAVVTSGSGSGSRTAQRVATISDMFAGSVRYNTKSSNGVNEDVIYQCVSIFR